MRKFGILYDSNFKYLSVCTGCGFAFASYYLLCHLSILFQAICMRITSACDGVCSFLPHHRVGACGHSKTAWGAQNHHWHEPLTAWISTHCKSKSRLMKMHSHFLASKFAMTITETAGCMRTFKQFVCQWSSRNAKKEHPQLTGCTWITHEQKELMFLKVHKVQFVIYRGMWLNENRKIQRRFSITQK